MLRPFAVVALSVLPVLSGGSPWAAECAIDVHADDQVRFDVQSIVVDRRCTTFTVNLFHTGQLDRGVMGHNWVLSRAADLMEVVADGAVAGLDHDYLKPGDPRVIAHTRVVGAGERDSVSFAVAGLEAGGPYLFFCSYPGHSSLMRGTLSVE